VPANVAKGRQVSQPIISLHHVEKGLKPGREVDAPVHKVDDGPGLLGCRRPIVLSNSLASSILKEAECAILA
jgi:hypothetical protein